jgi:hypothetical protein
VPQVACRQRSTQQIQSVKDLQNRIKILNSLAQNKLSDTSKGLPRETLKLIYVRLEDNYT